MSSKHLGTLKLAGTLLSRAPLLPVGHSGPGGSPGLGPFVTNSPPSSPFPGVPSPRNRLGKPMNLNFKGLPWEVKVLLIQTVKLYDDRVSGNCP